MLSDDPASVAAKLAALRAAGLGGAVLMYSETTPEILRAALSAVRK